MQVVHSRNRLSCIVLVVLFLGACGGSSGNSASTQPPQSEAPPATTPPEPVAAIRLYEAGDVVNFSGTLSIAEAEEPAVISEATVRVEFGENTYTYEDKNVLAAQSSMIVVDTGEESVRTVHFWQEANGAFHDLTDEYGNHYRNSATNETGLLAVPVPLLAHAEHMLQFYTMYGGHTSDYITMGERVIRIAEIETLSVPLGTFSVTPVTRSDDYQYARSFDDHKRDERIVDELTWWMDQANGVVKFHQVYRRYSSSGQLQYTAELDMEAR